MNTIATVTINLLGDDEGGKTEVNIDAGYLYKDEVLVISLEAIAAEIKKGKLPGRLITAMETTIDKVREEIIPTPF